jgi:hypothetical protein
LLIILLPVAEVVAGAVAEEEALAEAVAEEAALAEAVVVSVIPVEVPVRFKAVNPAVVQVVLEGVVKVSRIVKAVGVLEAGNLAEVVLAVSVILAEAPVCPKDANQEVVLVGLKGVVKAEIPEAEE